MSPDSPTNYRLHKRDPLYREKYDEVMRNHRERPYVRDALHETQPLMQSAMNPTLGNLWTAMGSLFSRKTWQGTDPKNTPSINVTNIDLLKNPELSKNFKARARQMEESGQNPNVTTLYSGHGPSGTEHIARSGHDPAYGQYHSGIFGVLAKGHGALGRGTYASDQVNKAVTYGSGGQKAGEERSILQYDVALGKTHETTDRGELRHRHHNELVRPPFGKAVEEGISAPREEAEYWRTVDSIKGVKSSTPGAGVPGTIAHSKQFDSNEFLIRNPDQILPKARIFYTLPELEERARKEKED
ncbi:hypothetical protein [Sphingomonas xinjiangensis]|uniref:Uncharacterized protein n=1 Tax=Sphingomonas xinjiangensis TaxID=643568 RepID=A0A840YH66_9SPHN|nr:hypothetical protein [Sphingomonas xinjiangensis]MBB5711339.1 hypothetical protein [Sphingomonas xinjiangensis]